jgi:SAM-dependent methyltransferase
MGSDSPAVAPDAMPLRLNLGCGFKRFEGFVNVDGFGNPDVKWDLNKMPWPWSDNSVDEIAMHHVLEHLQDWWGALRECARILQPGGRLEIRVPDASSDTALCYRDHLHIFNRVSFHGTLDALQGRKVNAWFSEEPEVPIAMIQYFQVPFREYNWMPRWLLNFCSAHLRNFIWEQRFIFQKSAMSNIKLEV